MIVIDSNILAYLYLPCAFTEAAENLLQSQPDWHAPLLWRSEFRNILLGYHRRGQLGLADMLALHTHAESLLQGREHEPDSHKVLELAAASNCSAYDCEFVALAQTLGCKLVTMDKQVLKAFADTALPLV